MTHAARVDLGDLGLDRGGHLLLKRALAPLDAGASLLVEGAFDGFEAQLRAYCRKEAHRIELAAVVSGGARLTKGRDAGARHRSADRAGHADRSRAEAVVDAPPRTWGLAPRGALVERGLPPFDFAFDEKASLWSDDAARLYAQAAAAQWDPARAIPWDAAFDIPDEVEDAVVQVMTYLIENETAALVIPARIAGRMHPHFREVMQLLAIQAADEARHIEIFTRRALLRRRELGLSTVGGQLSLKTLLDEPDVALASFLLSVLGEGSFLALLWFLHTYGPDPVTREVARLAAQDEARHVAFGLAHLERHVGLDPAFRERLAASVEARHAALAETSGLNEEVFDALLLIAAGSFERHAIREGHRRMVALREEMDDGRRKRLLRLGFDDAAARALSSLHSRNFI